MGESKSQQKQRLQERLEKLRKLKQEGGEVNEEEMTALEQVEAEGVDAVDAEVLNQLIEETVTDAEEVTTSSLLHDLSVRFPFSLLAFPFILQYSPSLPPSDSHLYHSSPLPLSPIFLLLLPFSIALRSTFLFPSPFPLSPSFFSVTYSPYLPSSNFLPPSLPLPLPHPTSPLFLIPQAFSFYFLVSI